MERLATQFRTMQLFAHIGHNKVSGTGFFEDHEFLGGLYGTYEGIYDGLVERLIGLGKALDLWRVNNAANEQLQGMQSAGTSSIEFLTILLEGEKSACSMVESLVKSEGLSQATINFLAQIADDSEARQYQIQQRLGKLAVTEKPGDALDRLVEARRKEKEQNA
jgi:DNA-binding ferritin-like protein